MSCQEMEETIYTYRELDEVQQREVNTHTALCESCRALLYQVTQFQNQISDLDAALPNLKPGQHLAEKVLKKVSPNQAKRTAVSFSIPSYSRMALAAVSCGLLVLFFVEIMVPDLKSGKVKGPISSIQGAIINSSDLRKAFTNKTKKKTLFDDCKDALSNKVDVVCVKQKIGTVNF